MSHTSVLKDKLLHSRTIREFFITFRLLKFKINEEDFFGIFTDIVCPVFCSGGKTNVLAGNSGIQKTG